jgi:hypothetical protein
MTAPNTRAALRAEAESPLDADFDRREKDGVPHANNPRNVRLALFRLGYQAAREKIHHLDRVLVIRGGHEKPEGHELTADLLSNLRFDIHREYQFLPGKALVKDVLTDMARAWDVRWTDGRMSIE